MESVLRTVLNPDGTLTAYRHSGIGDSRIETMAFGLYKSKDKKARSMKKKDMRDLMQTVIEGTAQKIDFSLCSYLIRPPPLQDSKFYAVSKSVIYF